MLNTIICTENKINKTHLCLEITQYFSPGNYQLPDFLCMGFKNKVPTLQERVIGIYLAMKIMYVSMNKREHCMQCFLESTETFKPSFHKPLQSADSKKSDTKREKLPKSFRSHG